MSSSGGIGLVSALGFRIGSTGPDADIRYETDI